MCLYNIWTKSQNYCNSRPLEKLTADFLCDFFSILITFVFDWVNVRAVELLPRNQCLNQPNLICYSISIRQTSTESSFFHLFLVSLNSLSQYNWWFSAFECFIEATAQKAEKNPIDRVLCQSFLMDFIFFEPAINASISFHHGVSLIKNLFTISEMIWLHTIFKDAI